MIWRSLKFRLFAAAAICIVGALVLYWSVLSQIFEQHVSERLYKELEAHLNQLTTRLEASDRGEVAVTDTLDNPRFERPFGGLYWQVKTASGEVYSSRSLWDQTIVAPAVQGRTGEISRHRDVKSNAGTLLLVGRTVVMKAGAKDLQVRLIVAMDQNELTAARASFASDVSILVALLALFLFAAMAVQTLIGLRPLSTLRQRVSAISTNRRDVLDGQFPSEVEPLVAELNSLLSERTEMVDRARASASDLAHGLKTPLAILAAEGRAIEEAGHDRIAREINLQIGVMNRQIERQLARARARGQQRLVGHGTELKPAISKLIRAFRQLPRGREISWQEDIAAGLRADIDAMDLEEVAGNILDNARKWADDKVIVSARAHGNNEVAIVIEDNGPGVPQQQSLSILQRGSRMDEETPGSGLGLAITQDILEIYNGRMDIGNLEPHGLKIEIFLPASGEAARLDENN
ncbi:MAG: ATP-binding protein [Pseudomonadota bacterium]